MAREQSRSGEKKGGVGCAQRKRARRGCACARRETHTGKNKKGACTLGEGTRGG